MWASVQIFLFHVYLRRWNTDWAQFPSLRGKASQQAWYWPHPPGEGAGQCNRVQGTILDHLTIISKCTPAAISARPPWECSSVFYSAPREPCNANSTHHSRGNNGKKRRGGVLESNTVWAFLFLVEIIDKSLCTLVAQCSTPNNLL